MASKRRLRRQQCEKKQPLTREEAQRRAAILNNKGPVKAHQMDAYQCKVDPSHWHVGHRPKRVQQAVSAKRREARRRA